MKYLLMVYTDDSMMASLPAGEADSMMRHCFAKADEMQRGGVLIESQQLEEPQTAKSVRVRNGRLTVVDGPFAETKEVLGGFNLIEADSMDAALEYAKNIPWAQTGCIEVRPVRDLGDVRRRVGAPVE